MLLLTWIQPSTSQNLEQAVYGDQRELVDIDNDETSTQVENSVNNLPQEQEVQGEILIRRSARVGWPSTKYSIVEFVTVIDRGVFESIEGAVEDEKNVKRMEAAAIQDGMKILG